MSDFSISTVFEDIFTVLTTRKSGAKVLTICAPSPADPAVTSATLSGMRCELQPSWCVMSTTDMEMVASVFFRSLVDIA